MEGSSLQRFHRQIDELEGAKHVQYPGDGYVLGDLDCAARLNTIKQTLQVDKAMLAQGRQNRVQINEGSSVFSENIAAFFWCPCLLHSSPLP